MSAWRALCDTVVAALRDRGLLVLFIFAVPAYSFYYPLAYQTQEVRDIPIEVVDLDCSGLSRRIAFDIGAAPSVRVVGRADSLAAASDRLASGHSAGIIVIPVGFQRDIPRGSPTAVTVFDTGAYPVQYKAVLTAVAPVVLTLAAQIGGKRLAREGAPPLVLYQAAHSRPPVIERGLFNVTGGYGNYVVATAGILIVHQVLLMAAAALAGTWVEQRSGPLFEEPVARVGAVWGSASGLALFGLAALLYMIGFAFWFQDYPRGANLAGALMFAPLMALTVACLSLCLGGWFGVRERALQAMLATSVPLLFLSGQIFPAEAIPAPMRALGALLPTTPGIAGFLKFNQRGASIGEAMPEVLHMVALLVLYAVLAAVTWRRISNPAARSGRQHAKLRAS